MGAKEPPPGEGRVATALRVIAGATGVLLLVRGLTALYANLKKPFLREAAPPRRMPLETPDPRNVPVRSTAEARGEVLGRPARLPDPEDLAAGYELSDVTVRSGANLLLVAILVSAFAFVIVTGFQWLWTGRINFIPPEQGIANPPESEIPEVIESRARTGLDYAEMRAQQEEMLGSYGWVDEEGGAVRIPVERAMDLMLEDDAFPARPGGAGADFRDNGLDLPLDSSSGRALERTIDP